VTVAAAGLSAPAVIASPNKKIKWKFQTHWPTGNWYYDPIFNGLARRIQEATNGELEIETHNPTPSSRRETFCGVSAAARSTAPSFTRRTG